VCSNLSFVRFTDKLAVNWQNFARIGLQLEFVFRIRPYGPLTSLITLHLINERLKSNIAII